LKNGAKGRTDAVSEASRKKTMKSGMESLPFSPCRSEIRKTMGVIQRVRVSFMMVAVCSDASPSTAAAPTTELVSWMLNAHQTPYCSGVSGSNDASSGKATSATAFSRKTTPMATPMSSSRTFITEDTAAMALPPQMDVPKVTSFSVAASTLKNRSRKKPSEMITARLTAVCQNPWPPTEITCRMFRPNPKRTTALFSASLRIFPSPGGAEPGARLLTAAPRRSAIPTA